MFHVRVVWATTRLLANKHGRLLKQEQTQTTTQRVFPVPEKTTQGCLRPLVQILHRETNQSARTTSSHTRVSTPCVHDHLTVVTNVRITTSWPANCCTYCHLASNPHAKRRYVTSAANTPGNGKCSFTSAPMLFIAASFLLFECLLGCLQDSRSRDLVAVLQLPSMSVSCPWINKQSQSNSHTVGLNGCVNGATQTAPNRALAI